MRCTISFKFTNNLKDCINVAEISLDRGVLIPNKIEKVKIEQRPLNKNSIK